MVKCAIYARVSKPKTQKPDSQIADLESFASKQSDWTITHRFIDRETGTRADRPALLDMLNAADRREFDMLLFWRFDRLSRGGILPTLELLKTLDELQIGYHSHQERVFRSSGPLGHLMVSIYATFAQIERDAISERTRAGLAQARRKGKILGRPRRILDAQRAADLAAGGRSYTQIATMLGVSPNTVRRRLCNDTPPSD